MSLYLFDLDGTLIEGYMDRPDKAYEPVVPLPGRVGKVGRLLAEGHTVCVVTNQGGVALGFVTEDQATDKLLKVARMFGLVLRPRRGVPPKRRIFVCYAHSDGKPPYDDPYEVERRKPSPLMLFEAMREHGATSADTIFVGDRPEDEQAAKAAEVRYIGPADWDEWWWS